MAASNSIEQNKKTKLRYIAGLNKQDFSVFDEVFEPDYTLHVAGMPDFVGADSLKEMVIQSFAGLSNAKWIVEDIIAEDDRVATRWSMTALHTGEYMGVPATNKEIQLSGTVIDRFENGRIIEAWENFDSLGLMQQLGTVPASG